ncbi:Peroxisomal membrane protein 4 [Colletotrichum tanaceti]|uniref:Peroxisomal membrane protein 4 n=1 Tax=Colletotrichum tanaceti TaxID=1306861 RepID=A0A4U6XJB5_9PEZI|nr:Peroxisomal membrane protein 4 [Colletotrichum tanaceti]TKW55633.1 Peroxisomal membrane protein 4 [Colletotrichum tanaceti]
METTISIEAACQNSQFVTCQKTAPRLSPDGRSLKGLAALQPCVIRACGGLGVGSAFTTGLQCRDSLEPKPSKSLGAEVPDTSNTSTFSPKSPVPILPHTSFPHSLRSEPRLSLHADALLLSLFYHASRTRCEPHALRKKSICRERLHRCNRHFRSDLQLPRLAITNIPNVPNMSLAALDGLKAAIERIILDPKYHDILAVVKGARNGAVYGAKVRFPHALVYVATITSNTSGYPALLIFNHYSMIFLFRSGTFREKAGLVFRATRMHARNLAKFATIYKFTMYLLKNYGPTPGKEGPYDAFFAGLLGGYIVFGGRSSRSGKISSVNQQIVVYVFARVVLALARLAVTPGKGLPLVSREDLSTKISYYAWPVFASTSWAMVMYLFRQHPSDLQPSLRSSMTYIYQQSSEWDSLRNFIWHNK